MQNLRPGSISAATTRVPVRATGPGRRRRVVAVSLAASSWLVSSAVLAGPALAASNGSTNVDGSQRADKWPLIKTLGIFGGIPLAAAILIVFLVMLGPILRSGRTGGTEDAVFAGPHAGSVDTGADSGNRFDPTTQRDPKTHTGDPDGPSERPAGVAGSADAGPTSTVPTAQGGAGATW